MGDFSNKQRAWHGFLWGALGGLALVALMYLTSAFSLLRPLPQLLNQPLLSILPGPVFGFLIDTLQHAGKVVEELGFIVGMVVGLAVLGALWALSRSRWPYRYSHYLFAAFAWLIVTFLLLPLGGSGFLGLSDGLTTPLLWAALFAAYAFVLELDLPSSSPLSDPPTDLSRRRFLSALPLTIGALSLGGLALLKIPNWYTAVFNPPEVGLHGLTPAITPVRNFYVVSKNFSDPNVDAASWRLSVGGLIDKPLNLSLTDLRALASTSEDVTLECISNNVGGPLMSTGTFTGVSLRDLLALAHPRAGASWVAFSAVDGYTESLPLPIIMSSPEILVAYDLDGAPLPTSHGYPARILLPGRYGMKGPKWLNSISLVDKETGGYWEQQGWDHQAFVRTTSRFDTPIEGDRVKLGPIPVAGVAFAGKRGIQKVEYSTDGGSSWSLAAITPPLSAFTWVLWSAQWTPSHTGGYRLLVRATDGAGALQSASGSSSYPSGASGYHTVTVDVTKS